MAEKTISIQLAQRLTTYLRLLKDSSFQGVATVSSTKIAECLFLTPIQVRKDLAAVSQNAGQPKIGFVIADLIRDINKYLKFDKVTKAVLVGVGSLGRALLGYGGFPAYGLNILAAFDINPKIIGTEVNGKKVYGTEKLPELIKENSISAGILTVPKEHAQTACDLMIKSGIKAIWNFTSAFLSVPKGIIIKSEDMAAGLSILTSKLAII